MLTDLIERFLPAIDAELLREVSNPLFQSYPGLESIFRYHLGLEEGSVRGKRIRPLIVLLSAGSVGADWRCALPSAAAVELLHNFSLIHDDIEDGSSLRRGRETVWMKWGAPLAINAGDAMFTLAFSALLRLNENVNPEAVLRSVQVLAETSLRLTGGQHLDIALESGRAIEMDVYWEMVSAKTAALLSACGQLGAIAGQAKPQQEYCLAQFGYYLGLAFQAWDDWLGIWGNASEMGKSNESDLVAGKKTLPVVFALSRGGRFADRWNRGPIQPEEVDDLSHWLIETGAKDFTEAKVSELTSQAIDVLHDLGANNEYVQGLEELALSLVKRRK